MSLRLRLVLALGAVALVALVAADIAVYASFRSSLFSSLDATLDSTHPPIERQLSGGPGALGGGIGGNGPPDGRVPPAQGGGPSGVGIPATGSRGGAAPGANFCLLVSSELGAGTIVEVRTSTGATVADASCVGGAALGSAPAPVLAATDPVPSTPGPGGGPGLSVHFDAPATNGSGEFRVDETELANHDILLVAASLTGTDNSLSRLLLEEILTSLAALVLAIALGFWLVGIGLRPLGEVERTADAITGGDLTQRVPGEERRTEVGTVALAINTMLRRIEGAFAERDETESALRGSERRLRQFVADASHELRTPIAAVSAYAELFATGAAEPEHRADLERVMAGIRSETARMGGLVEDLLLLARLDDGRPLERRSVELVALCSEAIRTATAVGPGWPVRLDAAAPVEVLADAVRLRQVVDNLLLNVRSHTPAGTPTVVRVMSDGKSGSIEVADNGPGFPDGEIDRVFERFYRADRSRARSSGGSGLGLAIVASIVGAHGGSVRASNREGGGATVVVSVPLNAPLLPGGQPQSDGDDAPSA